MSEAVNEPTNKAETSEIIVIPTSPVKRLSVPAANAVNAAVPVLNNIVKEQAYNIIACLYKKGFNYDFIRYAILPHCINEKTRHDGDIREAVKEWLTDSVAAEKKYGPIAKWDVSRVTNMDGLFRNQKFNEDISSWDVSNVISMSEMFLASRFNQDIRRWNVSKVTNMRSMFRGNWIFNHNIGAWDVSHVTSMEWMLAECHAFCHDLSKWDVSNVTKSHFFCFGASSFEKAMHEPKFPHKKPNQLPL